MLLALTILGNREGEDMPMTVANFLFSCFSNFSLSSWSPSLSGEKPAYFPAISVGDLFDNKSHGIFFQKHCYTSFTFNRVCVYVFKKKTSAQPYQKPRPNLFLLEPVPVTIDTFRNHSFVGESIWSKC